jgi:hypothetical protein
MLFYESTWNAACRQVAELHVGTHVYQINASYTLKNGVFWDVTLCGSCENLRFGGTQRLLHQGWQESVN